MTRKGYRRFALTASVVLPGLLVVYYLVDPAHTAWMPRCLFRTLTGWECPACGGQRALHSLLHCRPGEAFGYNPFLVISLPYAAAVAWTTFGRSRAAVRWRPVVQHRAAAYAYCVLFVAWWVVRNL